VSGCADSEATEELISRGPGLQSSDIQVDKVEVIHFHGKNQCYSCVTVGEYAAETVSTFFSAEVASGLVEFRHVNGELPENAEMVMRYGARGSSLWLGTYDANGFHAEENTIVWYRLRNKADYMEYLKGEIETKLRGG
jgi:hypothetical protein